jgi:glucosamine-6-phosphate deaminase
VGEGWFAGLDDVPQQAISMAIRRIMASELIVCSVPDARKAEAVRGVVQGTVTPQVPASILREHPRCSLHLDKPAAGLL